MKSRGFTLTELLVVIAIIGILSSIVIANVNPARESARDAKRQTDLSQIAIALRIYNEQNGYYPGGDNQTTEAYNGKIGTGGSIDTALAPYMSQVPKDPLNDSEHYYFYDEEHLCNGRIVPVVFSRSLEATDGNLAEVCSSSWGTEGNSSASTNPFVIILN